MAILRGTALPHPSPRHLLEIGKGLVTLRCRHLSYMLVWHLAALNVSIATAAQKGGEGSFVL